MGGLALLSTLSDLFASGAKAKGELSAEADARKKLYSDLETSALQREHLRQQMRLAEYPPNELERQIRTMEKAMGRPLTDVEKERAFGIAPKESSLKVATKLVQDANSKTGWSFVSYDPISGAEYSRQLYAPPQRGLIESETDTTDPVTGLTTVSHRKPILGGQVGAGGGVQKGAPGKATAPTPVGPATSPSPPAVLTSSGLSPAPARAGARRSSAGPLAAQKPPQTPPRSAAAAGVPSAALAPALAARGLDAQGHIPPLKGVPPAVVETANELLDDKDMDKIKYAKLIPVAAALARKYGWEQGKFTPKEQVMLRETSTFLQRAMTDGSMAVLDEGTVSRLKLMQLIQNPDKEGMLGRGAQTIFAQGMTPSQVKFVQTYNQLVGTISGLSQLVRSGRATEATIERLKAELPNPITTKNSADAMQRLQRLMDEINVAMRKGSFISTGDEVDQQAREFRERVRQKHAGGASAPR